MFLINAIFVLGCVLLLALNGEAFLADALSYGRLGSPSFVQMCSQISTTADIDARFQRNYSDSQPTIKDKEVICTYLDDMKVEVPWRDSPECSTRTFNWLLSVVRDSTKNINSVAKSEEIFHYMLQQSAERGLFLPNATTLNTMLAIFSKAAALNKNSFATRNAAAEKAKSLIKDWQQYYEKGLVSQRADLVSFNTVISTLANAKLHREAEEVFLQMEDEGFHPDIITYNSLIKAFATAGMIEKAGSIFKLLRNQGPTPTIHSYNGVLYAYANSDTPERAESFLNWWNLENRKQQEKSVVYPDTYSHNIVLHCMSRSSQPETMARAERLFRKMPVRSAVSYTTMIAMACKLLPGDEAIEKVQSIMEQAWNDTTVNVNNDFLSIALYSVATIQNKVMPIFAESIVTKALENHVMLNRLVYNALIYCWAKSNDRDAGKRAMEILEQMANYPQTKPDAKSYTNVLDAFRTSKSADGVVAAETIIDKMESKGPEPNVHAYTALIMNYAWSQLPDKALKAALTLDRMKKAGVKPNIITYNAVLNACEHTNPSGSLVAEEALKVARDVFEEIRNAKHVSASHVTYSSFLGTLANLMPPESRQEILGLVFRRCCAEGQVSRVVLKKLRSAAITEERYRTLIGFSEEDRMPESWSRNVVENKARNEPF